MMGSMTVDGNFQEIRETGGLDSNKVVAAGEVDDDGKPRRTGTVWTASAHIITTVIGSGVLSLSWGVAQLGWVTGVITLIVFACITFYTSNLLADCYRFPDPVSGYRRHYTYVSAVKSYLGGAMHLACAVIQCTDLCGLVIGYTVTASTSMVAIKKSNCFHKRGHEAPCKFSNNPFMIGFGIFQLVLSQIPNFHNLSWLSSVAAVMSFGYASIGIGLALVKVISGDGGMTSLTGVETGVGFSAAQKMWKMFRAFGDIAFAYTYSQVLIEIQDTLKSTPPENKVMKKASLIGGIGTTTFYMMCGCFGYAAFGNKAPGNMLTGFGFYEPFWLVDLANVFIVVHLAGAYQIFAQPVFSLFESWARVRWPKSKFVAHEYLIRIGKMNLRINLLRLTWRTSFVMVETVLAMALPFFNEILALLGALGFWPLTVYFPVEMYIAQQKIERGTPRWIALQLLNSACLLMALAAAAGSIQGLNAALHASSPFKFKE